MENMNHQLSNVLIFALVTPFFLAMIFGFEYWPVTNYPMYSSISPYNKSKTILKYDLFLKIKNNDGSLREEIVFNVHKKIGIKFTKVDQNLGLYFNTYKIPDWEHYRKFPKNFFDQRAEAYYNWYMRKNPNDYMVVGMGIYLTEYKVQSRRGQKPNIIKLMGEYQTGKNF